MEFASPSTEQDGGSSPCELLVQWPAVFPTELIATIFKITLLATSATNFEGFPTPSRRAAPLTLTWVCTTWRHLALSLPQLWTSISLGSNGTRPSSDIPILSLFLSRSGNSLPLSFIIDYEPNESCERGSDSLRSLSESYLGGMRDLARELIPLRHRWRVLSLNALVFGALEPFLRALGYGAPQLSYLKVSTKFLGFYGAHHALELTSCPRLETVRILSPMIFSDPSIPHLQSLQFLELRFCQSQLDAITWLSACSQLKKLRVRLYAAQPTAPTLMHRITLDHLEELSLTCLYGDSDPGSLLSSLVAPKLTALSLLMCDLIPTDLSQPWHCISQLLQRSNGQYLKQLELIDTPMSPQEVIRVLSLVQNVQSLTLGGNSVTDEVLLTLTAASASTFPGVLTCNRAPLPLCPKLESLELHEIAGSTSTIADLARSRAWTGEEAESDTLDHRTLRALTLTGFSNFLREHLPQELQFSLKILEPEMEYVPESAISASMFSI